MALLEIAPCFCLKEFPAKVKGCPLPEHGVAWIQCQVNVAVWWYPAGQTLLGRHPVILGWRGAGGGAPLTAGPAALNPTRIGESALGEDWIFHPTGGKSSQIPARQLAPAVLCASPEHQKELKLTVARGMGGLDSHLAILSCASHPTGDRGPSAASQRDPPQREAAVTQV